MDVPGSSARRLLAALALATALTPAAAHAATLSVEHSAFTATEVGPGADGVRAPGDQLDVTETVLSAEPQTVSGVTGTLSAPNGDVNILTGTRPFGDLLSGLTSSSSAPFRIQIPTGAECGAPLNLSLHLSAGADGVDIPFTVPTGARGASTTLASSDVPLAIPNPGVLTSNLPVSQAGRVKGVAVRIGRLDHTFDQDLRISLISPDGTRVVLADGRGGSGDGYVNTVIGDQGDSFANGVAPFTGSYRAEGDLSAFYGKPMQGTWRLEVVDSVPADAGTLIDWGLDLAGASCIPQLVASFSATPQAALPGQNVTFDASSSSDPVGTITGYQWDLDGNGTYETSTGTTPTLVHAFASRGAHVVGLKVTDDHGATDTATRTVSVATPPVASFTVSPAHPLSLSDVDLDASASHAGDAGGTLTHYEWDVDGNGSFETDGGASPILTTQFTDSGPVSVRLRVTDDTGATATATVPVVVDNRPPVARLTGPSPVVAGAPATFDAGTSTDTDGTIVKYEFDLDGNGTFETDQGATSTVQHTFLVAGTYSVGVRVTDSDGATSTKTLSLHVTDAPVAALVPSALSLRPRQVVTLDATASHDPDGSIVAYAFDLDGDGTFETNGAGNPLTSTSFTTLGAHTIRVRVTDNAGATATATTVVTVVDLAPVAVLSAGPNPATAGTPVTFDAGASTDPDGTIARYEWDLDGNGTFERDTQGTSTLTFAYPNPGTFTARVRVTDNDGVTTIASLPVHITTPTGGGGTGGGAGGGGTGGGTHPGGGGTGGGTYPGGGGTGGGALPGDTQLNAGLSGAPLQKIRVVAKKGLDVACVADRPVRCTLVAEIQPADAKRLKLVRAQKGRAAKAYRIGRKTVTAVRGAGGAARFKLSATLKRVLAKQRSVLVVVRGSAVDEKGRAVKLTRAVLLRR